ncbi:hypothetical protein K490DRAFT_67647 [Saccharata proteae CBS 121410]|uniref:Uncharacterized protein n=1 Tax=Saccharata proteae CBS 121410 TaxID=1314787 RepID=A0A9P4HT19_9PEZI|nr:hypothetical protein K490DRAFT_67647 [Saccharata proteae CBS 121410]
MMEPSVLRITQLSISGLCLCLSIAIIGTAGHSLQVYRSQYLTNPWWLPLWNAHFDVHGTNTLIGAGATALFLNLVFIGCCLFPKLRLTERPTLRALLTLAVASLSCIVAFAAVIFVHVLNNQSPQTETIQTWTCKFKGKKPASGIDGSGDGTGDTGVSIPTDISNAAFGELCEESKFALYALLVVFLLQGSMLAVAVLAWCVDKWTARKNKKFHDVSNVEMQAGPGGEVYDGSKRNTNVDVRAVAY